MDYNEIKHVLGPDMQKEIVSDPIIAEKKKDAGKLTLSKLRKKFLRTGNSIVKKANKLKPVYVFFIGILSILLLCFLGNVQDFPYDSGVYWNFGFSYGIGNFKLTNFGDAVRGYLLPLLYYVLQDIAALKEANPVHLLWISKSIIYAFVFTLLIPAAMSRMIGKQMKSAARLLFLAVSMFYFKGLIIYPLSDMLAFTFSLSAVTILMILIESKSMKWWNKCLLSFALGALLAGSYYIRPVYLSSIIIALCGIVYYVIRRKKFFLLIALLGMVLVATPECIVNKNSFQNASPMMQTGEDASITGNLYLFQLSNGLSIQKYETNMDEAGYPNVKMGFRDQLGSELLVREAIHEFSSFPQYFKFAFKHLPDLVIIYCNHLFNGVDIVYPNVYIYDVRANRFFLQFFNYLLLFLGITEIGRYLKKNVNKKNILQKKWYAILYYFVPVLLVIPSCVETRFFLALSVFIFYFACIRVTNTIKSRYQDVHIKGILQGALFILICFMLNALVFNTVGITLWK